MKLDPRGEQRKPHVILRTHSGVPTPPAWANWFRVYWRLGNGICASTTDHEVPIARVADIVWDARYRFANPVAAVEWLR